LKWAKLPPRFTVEEKARLTATNERGVRALTKIWSAICGSEPYGSGISPRRHITADRMSNHYMPEADRMAASKPWSDHRNEAATDDAKAIIARRGSGGLKQARFVEHRHT